MKLAATRTNSDREWKAFLWHKKPFMFFVVVAAEAAADTPIRIHKCMFNEHTGVGASVAVCAYEMYESHRIHNRIGHIECTHTH